MLVLGIECTAHTFGVGIVDCKKRRVLFNQKSLFKNKVGMDLRKLTDFHTKNFKKILVLAKKFLEKKGMNFYNLDLISFSQGPGIGNSLKVAKVVAKTLSLKYGVKLVGVNHIVAHLTFGEMLTKFSDPLFLFVSGVNTQIIAKNILGAYRVYGETEDIGLGNLLDSVSRLLGLGFPGGHKIEALAKSGKNLINLPMNIKGMNINFSGVFSKIKSVLKNYRKEDICFSLQETVFSLVIETVERALAYTNKKEFVIVGGVSANKRLSEMAKKMCFSRRVKYRSFDAEYSMDNGAMIAWQGFVKKDLAKFDFSKMESKPYITVLDES